MPAPAWSVALPARRSERADRDAEVEVAAQVDVAEGPAVEPAAARLELVDDLHGADLRRAGERARRERRDERVERVGPAPSSPTTELTMCITWE